MTTLALGELDRLQRRAKVARFFREEYFFEAQTRWRSRTSTENAADVLVSAFSVGREEEVLDAAELLISRDDVSIALRRIADSILSRGNSVNPSGMLAGEPTIEVDIAAIRRRLNAFPRNPLLWADLSRLYIVKAQPAKSRRAMEIALGLAPNNRFVLRSAARLFVHLREADRAHEILARSPATPTDPWLVAAEIAVASVAERSPRHVRQGRRLLGGDHSPTDTAELTSALATEELFGGRHRKARQLFAESLEAPTENAVAQAEWAVEALPSLEVTRDALDVPHSFEANALNSFHLADWTTSLRRCQEWAFDEPFSKRPWAMGSYIAIVVLEDYGLAKSLADQGLKANPADPLLKNNLAVALVNLGQTDRARRLLSTISESVRDHETDALLQATKGLVCFRSGDLERGRVLYQEAAEAFRAASNPRAHALATLHLAREEFLAHGKNWQADLFRAEALSRASHTPDVEAMLGSLRKQTSTALGRILSTPDWVRSLRVESREAAAVKQRMREALKTRGWLLDLVSAKPFVIEASIDGSKLDIISKTAPLALLSPLSVDVSSVLVWEKNSGPEGALFLALYPSGAVRSIAAGVRATRGQSYLVLHSPVALIDPELPADVQVSDDMNCTLVVQAISSPSNG